MLIEREMIPYCHDTGVGLIPVSIPPVTPHRMPPTHLISGPLSPAVL